MLKHIIVSFMLIAVATKCLVAGLQCYVCEDCNEYEDFKELHICGEISIDTTIKPVTIPALLVDGSNATKPISLEDTEEYIYDYSGEAHASSQNSSVKHRDTTTAKTTTPKSTITKSSATTLKPTTLKQTTTTLQPIETKTKETTLSSSSLTKTETTSSDSSTTLQPKPIQLTDYDDYLEYDDLTIVNGRSSRSLLKVNEPVCYMIKYHANNTVITNRGCTTFINANKHLTCQSLYNGAPMETCRICSSDGCNKFLNNDGAEDDHGIVVNAAGAFKNNGIFSILLLTIIFSTAVF